VRVVLTEQDESQATSYVLMPDGSGLRVQVNADGTITTTDVKN